MHGAWLALFVILWVVLLGTLVMVLGLSARIGVLEAGSRRLIIDRTSAPDDDGRVAGPPVGTQTSLRGEYKRLLDDNRAGDGLAILFLSSSCGPCLRLHEALGHDKADKDADEAATGGSVIVVTDETGSTIYKPSGLIRRVIVQRKSGISRSLGINATPFGLVIDRNGVVTSSGIPQTRSDVEALARLAVASPTSANAATPSGPTP